MARELLLLVHRVPIDGAFTLNDLAGSGGRVDEVARVVSTALTVSNGLRRDTRVTLLFRAADPAAERRIVIEGSRVRYLNPDERSTAALIKNALVRSVLAAGPVESSPGLTVHRRPALPELTAFLDLPGTLWLDEVGAALPSEGLRPPVAAILADPIGPSEEERALLESRTVPRYRVGPLSLRSSQVVDVLWNAVDRGEVAP
ncbi:MAG TPA: tRNA (pseudouridine(54)-N(1))-methyltransferase TrmY, partial [Thermoplasmata archaeon]|nr:tRNA (pseudouridine(54)-N(1))-methyltransferase TrmY [Thermoplasmata archaeon]